MSYFRWQYHLHKKLSIALLLLLLGLGFAVFTIAKSTAEKYFLEFTQRLNAPIAMYMAGVSDLFFDQHFNQQAFKELAGHVMVVNPSVEIYLLDTEGNIISTEVDPTEMQRQSVDLAPIRAFLAGDDPYPLLGEDPKGEHNIFSVHPIVAGDNSEKVEGYLYAILAGSMYRDLLASVQQSHILKSAGLVLILALAITFIAGIVIFYALTVRLHRLTRTVAGLEENDFNVGRDIDLPTSRSNDEVDGLAKAVSAMLTRISQQYHDLQSHDRERRELIANISHDLRTPLTSMQGYIETLLIKWPELSEEERTRYLKTAHKNGKRLRQLISNLFEIAKFDSGQVALQREVFCLPELLSDIVQDFHLKAEQRDINIGLDIDQHDVKINADIALIHRVLENLINNALRHTPRNGQIDLQIHCHNDCVKVSVRDNGSGMDSESLSRIFDRHYSTGGSGEGAGEHIGLGLAIVKRILDLHNASIDVRSKPDEGAEFFFELPVAA